MSFVTVVSKTNKKRASKKIQQKDDLDLTLDLIDEGNEVMYNKLKDKKHHKYLYDAGLLSTP